MAFSRRRRRFQKKRKTGRCRYSRRSRSTRRMRSNYRIAKIARKTIQKMAELKSVRDSLAFSVPNNYAPNTLTSLQTDMQQTLQAITKGTNKDQRIGDRIFIKNVTVYYTF